MNEIAYLITYWGVPFNISQEIEEGLDEYFDMSVAFTKQEAINVKTFLAEIKRYAALYDYYGNIADYSKTINGYVREKPGHYVAVEGNQEDRIKFFGGHQYQLGHFFRHLYQAVKYIDKQPWWLLGREEKYDYVKTLRAQMSNYEQALLLISSLTRLGRKWDLDTNKRRRIISSYNLVKNIPKRFIPDMEPDKYCPDVKYEYQD